jgi:hypothetical protein
MPTGARSRGYRVASAAGAQTHITVPQTGTGATKITSGEDLPVPGRPVAAGHSQLSEQNIEWMQTQPPQVEAEFLLSSAINPDQGATDWVNKLVDGWHGKLHPTQRWQDLQDTALYSNDLRVRAAAIEIILAVRNLAKTEETAEQLIQSAESRPGGRPFAGWELGMLANRGVEPQRIHEVLVKYMYDPDERRDSGRSKAMRISARTRRLKTSSKFSVAMFPWMCASAPVVAWQNSVC